MGPFSAPKWVRFTRRSPVLAIGIAWRALRRQFVARRDIDQLVDTVNTLRAQEVSLRQRLVLLRGDYMTDPAVRKADLVCCSQDGEDAWVWEYLGYPESGFYVEVGAHDGWTFSNSYFFDCLGWDGLLIEANPVLHERCMNRRPSATVVHAALAAEEAGKPVKFTVAEG